MVKQSGKEGRRMAKQSGGKGVGLFIAAIIVGALVGGILGEILGLIVTEGLWHELLVTGVSPTLSPVNIDFLVFNLTFGIGIKLNLLSILGVLTGILLYYKL